MDHLFVSPHADDAVACCGGTIGSLTRLGRTVVIRTLFAGPVSTPLSPAALELHGKWGNPADAVRLRRAEDAAAAARLGVRITWGETPEALYRRDAQGGYRYPTLAGIFGDRHPDDDSLGRLLAAEIREGITDHATCLIFPLGIGGHIDHLLAFEAGEALAREGRTVAFCEDFPYALNKEAHRQRLASLPPLASVLVRLSDEELLAKIEAFSYYRSQISMLFASHENMAVEFIEYARWVGGSDGALAERFWLPQGCRNPFE